MSEIHTIKCGTVNCYIVAHCDNAILVDTGTTRYRDKVLKECQKYHVRLIVLTHGHLDHCQNVAFLSNELQIPVAICKKDMDMIPDNMQQPMQATTILGKIIRYISIKSFHKNVLPRFIPSVYLNEGDDLDDYGIPAQIIELPGHTKGSIGIEVDGDKLIVGDALMNMFYPTVSMLYLDRENMIRSVNRIGALGERKIYFGHGEPKNNRNWI